MGGGERPLRVLFVMKHAPSIRNFESLIRGLAQRGHRVHLAFDHRGGGGASAPVNALRREFGNVTCGPTTGRKGHRWGPLATEMRLGIDYLRYLEPRYAGAPRLRQRAEEQAPMRVRALARLPLLRTRRGIRAVRRLLQAAERALPPPPTVDAFLRHHQPDVLLVTPLVGLGSRQADYVRSARRLGIPTVLCVHSWDNLTNKGLMRDVPDRVTVWNEAQKREAVELHGARSEAVVVTGASAYDHWFTWAPRLTRSEFCRRVGLSPERPFFLYVCSSPFIGPREAEFVLDWIRRLRASGQPGLAEAGILIRPHPQNAEQWRAVDRSGLAGVSIWPPQGADPIDAQAKADYYDSIHHSAAVVGVNTSALIEAAIVGRSVYTWLADEFRDTQEGTLHFHHLLEAGGGVLHVADTFEEHAAQLARALAEPARESNRAFLEAFVRPRGLEVPATPLLVEAVEAAAAEGARPRVPGPAAWGVRLGLMPLARYLYRRRNVQQMEDGVRDTDPQAVAVEIVASARARVAAIAEDGGRPVLAGPFVGEVGHELLYWIPFLTRAAADHPGLRERLTVVTRGGAGCWYANAAARQIDVYEFLSREEFQRLREEMSREVGRGQKQTEVSASEQALLDRIRSERGLGDAALLHPSVMYQAYWRLLKEAAPQLFDRLASYRPLPPPPTPPPPGLPRDYIAVRFYFNASLPDTERNRRFMVSLLSTLARTTDLVLLNTGMRLDDHHDLDAGAASRIHTVERFMTPGDNLAVQTAVIARARAFVGTYGGLSYLPPFFRVPSLCFYSERQRFRLGHLEAAQRVFRRRGWGQFVALDVEQAVETESLLEPVLALAR